MSERAFHEKLNSRKLALTVMVIATASGLLVNDLISGDNWVNVVSVVSGAYLASQAYIDKGK